MFEQIERIPPRIKRWVITVVIIVVGIVTGFVLLKFLLPFLQTQFFGALGTTEILIALTIVLTVLTITISLAKESLKYRYSTKRQIALKAKVEGHLAIITCSFENKSKNRIYPHNFYLFIDEGQMIGNSNECGFMGFPNVLEHVNNGFDCQLGTICKQGTASCYPKELLPDNYSGVHLSYKLKHLSPKSVTYIDPGECFAEDVTVKLKQGIYRAILVSTAENQDCVCANIQFSIDSPNHQQEGSL